MASVLVTGSSGFLGGALVPRLLKAGHEVVGLDPAPAKVPGYHHVAGDLSDTGQLTDLLSAHRITHVIHAGGISGPMLLMDRPAEVMAINVTGSLNLLHAALGTGVKAFLYCSSVSAIGDYYEEQPIRDDHPMRPVHPYGASKAAMDMVLRGLWSRVRLDLCSLRFTAIYGPGRQTSSVLDEIVAAALAGRDVSVPATTDRPYIFIDDAADAVVAACFSDRRRQLAYFIAYPEQVALSDLAAAAAEAGRPVRLVIDDTHPPAARGPLDIGPAIRDFGFAPKVDHREGIRRMIAARTAAPR
jgi:nucleoside-diphosphate-sugar epimerase